jgi:hypothetical protein
MSTGKKRAVRRSTGRKKPYRAPKLTVHGDIGALTHKGGKRNDGGGRPKTRTGTG